jgi:hypothetical protein
MSSCFSSLSVVRMILFVDLHWTALSSNTWQHKSLRTFCRYIVLVEEANRANHWAFWQVCNPRFQWLAPRTSQHRNTVPPLHFGALACISQTTSTQQLYARYSRFSSSSWSATPWFQQYDVYCICDSRTSQRIQCSYSSQCEEYHCHQAFLNWRQQC